MFKRFLLIFLSICILSCSLFIHSSASGNFTEYYEYNGQAISSSIADVLSGYAINTIRQFPDSFRYWVAFRVGEYRYAIVLFPEYDSYNLNTNTLKCVVDSCIVYFYNQRLASYTVGTQTRYQAGIEPDIVTGPITVQFTRGYAIGNVDPAIAVHPEYEAVLYFDYILYILYTLIILLFVFVAFKFLNKRWLLP